MPESMMILFLPFIIGGALFTFMFHMLFLSSKRISQLNKKIGKIISYVSYGIFTIWFIMIVADLAYSGHIADLLGNTIMGILSTGATFIFPLLVLFFVYSLIYSLFKK